MPVNGGINVDRCIAPLVVALNAAGVPTAASCCGHGYRPGNIALRDGREIVIAPDFTTGRRIDSLFPFDIHGSVKAPLDGGLWWYQQEVTAEVVGSGVAQVVANPDARWWIQRDSDPATGFYLPIHIPVAAVCAALNQLAASPGSASPPETEENR